MAFWDQPIIGPYSKNEEESVLKVRNYLKQRNGFICRKDEPDFGCDLDVELIVNESGASNWRFPIQLKSEEKLNLIKEKSLISYSFETSRLGYLINRLPATGLVILYSVEEDVCYFDYADKIYERLLKERDSEDWKVNDKVNIHIPIINRLNEKAVEEIYQLLKKRFEQAAKMQQAYGAMYNLPAIAREAKAEYDFNNPTDVKKFLLRHGMFMIDNQDISIIFVLISRMSNEEIVASKDLLFIAAVVYGEAGKFIDSEFYISKLKAKQLLDKETSEIIDFVHLKNELSRGDIDQKQFVEKLERLEDKVHNEQSKIIIEINKTFYRLLEVKFLENIPDSLTSSVQSIYEGIDTIKAEDRVKYLLRIWNSDNFYTLINAFLNNQFEKFHIRELNGDKVSIEEKGTAFQICGSLEKKLLAILDEAMVFARQNSDNLIQAYIFSLIVRHNLVRQLDYHRYRIPYNDKATHQNILQNLIYDSLNAYNLFIKEKYLKDAYGSLCHALEINALATMAYQYQLEFPEDKVKLTMQKLETDLDYGPYKLEMTNTLNTSKNNADTIPKNHFLKDFNDEQLDNYAMLIINSRKLPLERLQNIIDELKAYRSFYRRCTNTDIQVLKLLGLKKIEESTYQWPTRYILRNSVSGIETPPSFDMEHLLVKVSK